MQQTHNKTKAQIRKDKLADALKKNMLRRKATDDTIRD
jgi:hypothetical protein